MKYLDTNKKNKYVIDIEADSLAPTVIWCIVILSLETEELWKFYGETCYQDFRKWLKEHEEAIFIGHNAISYDIPNINRLLGTTISLDYIIDSLVLSYLYNPALENGHSLESYGIRLKFPKGDYNDWSHFSEEMLSYCVQDVLLTARVYEELLARLIKMGFSEQSVWIEHQIRIVIDQQQTNGFYFKKAEAEILLKELRGKQQALTDQIQKLFPPTLEEVDTYDYKLTKKGIPYSSYYRHLEKYPALRFNEDQTQYTVYELKPFNIGSPKQRIDKVLSLGYEPTKFTPKTDKGGGGNPQIDEDSLRAFAETSKIPEVTAIADWLVLQGRSTMIEGWLKNVAADSRVHGRVLTCGAQSRRMTHFLPNLANIPSAANGAAYGEECRSLWTVTPNLDRVLVGYDAKGLETHVLCHVLNNPRASQMLLEGDIHQVNADALTEKLGFPVVRGGGGAKTILYAAIFGSYPKKLGSILKKDAKVGAKVQKIIYDTVPGLGDAIEKCQTEWKQNNGLIRTIDGGFVRCPSEHAALNYNIQPNGGILMKLTSIMLDKKLKKKGIWHMKVVDVHDEAQHETDAKDAEELGKLAVQCITDAGEELGFRVRMTGSYKIGKNWSQTH